MIYVVNSRNYFVVGCEVMQGRVREIRVIKVRALPISYCEIGDGPKRLGLSFISNIKYYRFDSHIAILATDIGKYYLKQSCFLYTICLRICHIDGNFLILVCTII